MSETRQPDEARQETPVPGTGGPKQRAGRKSRDLRDVLIGTSLVICLTLLGSIVVRWTGYWAIALFFLALVVFLAARLSRLAILWVAALSGIMWNFFFIPPLYTLRIEHLNDALMFAIYVLVAVIMGHSTAVLRAREEEERRTERQTRALYKLAQSVIESQNIDEALQVAVRETGAVFGGDAAILLALANGQLGEIAHSTKAWRMTDSQRAAALWCHTEGKVTGRFTERFSQCSSTYVPVTTAIRAAGVLAIEVAGRRELSEDDMDLANAFADHVGAMVQRYDMAREAADAKLMEESQKLYKTLFSCVSHELKTPLAVIDAATAELRQVLTEQDQAWALSSDILQASARLREIVDNLLDMSRIESGRLVPEPFWFELDELVDAVKDHMAQQIGKHSIRVEMPNVIPVVFMDSGLLEHAVCNLVRNAAQYSADETEILLRLRMEDAVLIIDVIDKGPGIPSSVIDHIFEKFYRGPNARSGGTGLGLAIVRGLVQAMGGKVAAVNRPEGGAMFTIALPVKTTKSEEFDG